MSGLKWFLIGTGVGIFFSSTIGKDLLMSAWGLTKSETRELREKIEARAKKD